MDKIIHSAEEIDRMTKELFRLYNEFPPEFKGSVSLALHEMIEDYFIHDYISKRVIKL